MTLDERRDLEQMQREYYAMEEKVTEQGDAIAELAAVLWNLYENKLEPDKLHIILNRPETRALIAKHKGGQDDRA